MFRHLPIATIVPHLPVNMTFLFMSLNIAHITFYLTYFICYFCINVFLDVFPGSQTGFYQSGGATQQTGTHYGLQGFGQHNQSLATGNATPVGLQNYGPSFLSSSGLQIAAAAQQFRNPTGGLPGPGNAAPTFLSKHQPQEQPRQLKSPSGNQQDVLASVFGSSKLIQSFVNLKNSQPKIVLSQIALFEKKDF